MAAPVSLTPISAQTINALSPVEPIHLVEHIISPDGGDLYFSATLASGQPLPAGLVCTPEGELSGTPAEGVEGQFDIVIKAVNEEQEVLEVHCLLTIAPSNVQHTEISETNVEVEPEPPKKAPPVKVAPQEEGLSADELAALKSQIWTALNKKMPPPDINATTLYNRPVSIFEVYYMLERWASLTIWDALNDTPPTNPVKMDVEGMSKHYVVYDRGSCLVATPKDLFSHERTFADALQTARALAGEAYKRGWSVQLSGFDKMERAAWVELQHLEDVNGRKVEVMYYEPTYKELRIYDQESKERALKRAEQKP